MRHSPASFTPAERRAAIEAGTFIVSGGDGDEPIEPTPPVEGAVETPPVEGTVETPPVDALPEIPEGDAIQEADEAGLRETFALLGTTITERRAAATTAEDLRLLQDAQERQTRIRDEIVRRATARDELAAGLESVDAAAGELALPESLPDPVAPAPALATAAAIVASRGTQPPAAQNPPAPRSQAVMLAGAGLDTAQAGSPITLADLGRAIDAVKRGRATRVHLASIPAFEDNADGMPRLLSNDNGASLNDQLIRETQEAFRARERGETIPDAHLASICDPLDPIREIPTEFTSAEPVASIFPSRPAGRLGFIYTPSILLADVADGVPDEWTETEQDAVDVTDDTTWKPVVDIDCPTPVEVKAEFVAAALRFDITTEMSNPERIANATAALMAVKARNKESRILKKIDALSRAYHFVGDYGALPSLIQAVNELVAQVVYHERLEEPNYTLILPPGVEALLVIDRANRAYNPNGIERAEMLGELAAGLDGVSNIVESLDASASGEPGLPFAALNTVGAGAIAVPSLGNDYRVRLVIPSSAIYAETGEINQGILSSPDLVRQNKRLYFTEDGFMLAKNGAASWLTINVALCANGGRAGLIEPFECPAAS